MSDVNKLLTDILDAWEDTDSYNITPELARVLNVARSRIQKDSELPESAHPDAVIISPTIRPLYAVFKDDYDKYSVICLRGDAYNWTVHIPDAGSKVIAERLVDVLNRDVAEKRRT